MIIYIEYIQFNYFRKHHVGLVKYLGLKTPIRYGIAWTCGTRNEIQSFMGEFGASQARAARGRGRHHSTGLQWFGSTLMDIMGSIWWDITISNTYNTYNTYNTSIYLSIHPSIYLSIYIIWFLGLFGNGVYPIMAVFFSREDIFPQSVSPHNDHWKLGKRMLNKLDIQLDLWYITGYTWFAVSCLDKPGGSMANRRILFSVFLSILPFYWEEDDRPGDLYIFGFGQE